MKTTLNLCGLWRGRNDKDGHGVCFYCRWFKESGHADDCPHVKAKAILKELEDCNGVE